MTTFREKKAELEKTIREAKVELDSLEAEEGSRQWIGRCFKMVIPAHERVVSYYLINRFDGYCYYGLLVESFSNGSIIQVNSNGLLEPYWLAEEAQEMSPTEFTLEVKPLLDQILSQVGPEQEGGK